MSDFKVNLNGKAILVTGAAGFIGAHLVKRLFDLTEDITVIGLDNMNDKVCCRQWRNQADGGVTRSEQIK